MSAIATDRDLQALRNDILSHGDAVSWRKQLATAETEVIERIKSEWFVKAWASIYGDGYNYQTLINAFDEAKLNKSLLVNLVCYRAMAFFIYPSLTTDTDDGYDAFSRRAERYMAFHDGEWDRVSKMPLYDFTGDSTFDDLDRVQVSNRTIRLARA